MQNNKFRRYAALGVLADLSFYHNFNITRLMLKNSIYGYIIGIVVITTFYTIQKRGNLEYQAIKFMKFQKISKFLFI
ncbi:MAG: hypothetical protein EA393_03040 [Bacteroidetes bacterium]|nr:MAG: hypothetical protein EA393_03040 [Bacteroidota bacterium]